MASEGRMGMSVPSGQPDLSIIIVTWESADEIDGCLRSLTCASTLSVEIVVVDNASHDNTVALVRQLCPEARLIVNSCNRLYAPAVNQGLRVTTGSYVLLLNPDTEICPGALERMVNFLEDHPDAGAVGPQLIDGDGKVQPSCREFPSYDVLLWELTGLSRLYRHHPRFSRWRMGYFDHCSDRWVDQPMGACLLVRRQVVESVGPMDVQFPLFFNDVDWCYRIHRAAWKIGFLSTAQVRHRKGASTARIRAKAIVRQHQGFYRFLRKHHPHPFLLPLAGFVLVLGAPIRSLPALVTGRWTRLLRKCPSTL
jgi:GT2 family glycosyltransferase